MKKSTVFSGSGGQGIMSAGIMLAQAASEVGKSVTYLPEYGPEQRGGSAKCTVIINDEEIISPLIKKCDNLICMNEQSYKKFCGQLKEGGLLILNSNRVTSEVERTDVKVISLAVDDIAVELGNTKVANIIMLGALAGATGIITPEELAGSIKRKFASKKQAIVDLNLKALEKGLEAAKAVL